MINFEDKAQKLSEKWAGYFEDYKGLIVTKESPRKWVNTSGLQHIIYLAYLRGVKDYGELFG